MSTAHVQKSLVLMAILTVLTLPLLTLAAGGGPIVPRCNSTIGDVQNTSGQGTHKGFTDPCGWTQFVQLADNILKFMVYIAVPIAAIAFAYAGFLYLSSRGNSGQIGKAHGIFLNVFVGLVIVLIAWLVVDLILKSLARPESYIQILQGH